MAAVGLAFFTSGGGIVFPAIVARATAALNCATAATAMIERRIDPIVAIQPDRGGRISVDQKW
jgi:hypothetical protein